MVTALVSSAPVSVFKARTSRQRHQDSRHRLIGLGTEIPNGRQRSSPRHATGFAHLFNLPTGSTWTNVLNREEAHKEKLIFKDRSGNVVENIRSMDKMYTL